MRFRIHRINHRDFLAPAMIDQSLDTRDLSRGFRNPIRRPMGFHEFILHVDDQQGAFLGHDFESCISLAVCPSGQSKYVLFGEASYFRSFSLLPQIQKKQADARTGRGRGCAGPPCRGRDTGIRLMNARVSICFRSVRALLPRARAPSGRDPR